jgi:hypothetical protein
VGVEGGGVGSGDDGDVLAVAAALAECCEEVGQVFLAGGEVDGVDGVSCGADVLADAAQDGAGPPRGSEEKSEEGSRCCLSLSVVRKSW